MVYHTLWLHTVLSPASLAFNSLTLHNLNFFFSKILNTLYNNSLSFWNYFWIIQIFLNQYQEIVYQSYKAYIEELSLFFKENEYI